MQGHFKQIILVANKMVNLAFCNNCSNYFAIISQVLLNIQAYTSKFKIFLKFLTLNLPNTTILKQRGYILRLRLKKFASALVKTNANDRLNQELTG